MAIPQSYMEKYLKEVEGATFFGKKVTDLSKDELIVMAVSGWKAESEARSEGIRMVQFMKDLKGVIV